MMRHQQDDADAGLKFSVPLNPCFVPVVPVQWNTGIRLQAVVFKGFFFNLSMFVPVYQLYNKTTRILKVVNSVNQSGLWFERGFGKPVISLVQRYSLTTNAVSH
jgi:hypothetical protein